MHLLLPWEPQACTASTPESSRAALMQILGFVETAGRLLANLGPEAKERGALEALEKLKGRLTSFAEGEEEGRSGAGRRPGLARALVDGLAALFEQHEVRSPVFHGCATGASLHNCTILHCSAMLEVPFCPLLRSLRSHLIPLACCAVCCWDCRS